MGESSGTPRSLWWRFTRRLLFGGLLALILFAQTIAAWPVMPPAHAQGPSNPNPTLTPPSWLTPPATGQQIDLGHYVSPAKNAPVSDVPHAWPVSMQPARLILSQTAQQFVSSDGQLEVDLPANSLDATQLAQTRGNIALIITQVKPGGGGVRSEHIFFGTYEFQFFDGSGKPLTGVHLLHPLTLHYHLRPDQQTMLWKGQTITALWSQVQGSTVEPAIPLATRSQTTGTAPIQQTGVMPLPANSQAPTMLQGSSDKSGLDWSFQSDLSAPISPTTAATSARGKQPTGPAIQPTGQAVQASSVTFNTQAPQASWGTPADFQVGLSSGGLNFTYPLSLPPGPGGLVPNLALNYSSGSVDENHNLQAAAPWVGQGWSLDLGSVSWAQDNVTPGGTNTLEQVWHISDPSGIGGQLIPPDQHFSTLGASLNPTPSQLSSGVYLWHTAPESHAKVQEVNFGNAPCWRVWLPSGVMEEFGCTNDSRESYPDGSGHWNSYSWKLDLMTDRFGNQVHVSYQTIFPPNQAVRDAAISDITYDDPTCHSTTTACGTWNPKIDLHFDANQTVARLLNSGCGNGTPGQTRCDDPLDLSGSGGLPAPKVMSAYVLNDVQIKVNGNLLHEYDLSYNQGGPVTMVDPATGQSESVAGYLTLGKIAEKGTNGTSLNAPVITISYSQQWQHYSDLFSFATPNTDCSPYPNAPRTGNICYLWSQSWLTYYLSTLDNGRGWNESITWKEAHSNTWGVDSGAANDAFTCTSSQTSTNTCGRADDKNWSHVVVASRTATSNGVTSTWSYKYFLQTGVGATYPGTNPTYTCNPCSQTYDWGNQNDNDFADYYNGDFQSFQQVQVTQPDNSSQIHTYGATTGWGLANSSIACAIAHCVVARYAGDGGSPLATVFAGREQQEQDYDSQSHLLKQLNWSWSSNCPPPGVPGSANAAGGSIDPGGGFLFSELDHNNPVMVCDPRANTQDTYLTDGVTNNISDPRVVHTTATTTYDGSSTFSGSNCGTFQNGYDYGNVTVQDTTANDAGGQHVKQLATFCINDNVGSSVFLTDLAGQTFTQDAAGTLYGCHANFYGGGGFLTTPSQPDLTRHEEHTPYTGGCAAPGTLVATLHGYDSSGVPITNTDGDNHLGCTSGSTQFSACATYDTLDTHLLTATNAKNQTTTYSYDTQQETPEAGFGQWLMSTTDVNGQTTTYQYDALGRLTAIINPGDSVSSPSVTYTYINTCSAGKTTPCLELDTSTRFTVGGPTTTMKQWYDGWGRLVETQTPGPNLFSRVPAIPSLLITYTVYDNMGRATTKSLSYAVAATAGLRRPRPEPTTQRHRLR